MNAVFHTKDGQITITYETITPDKARRWLANNLENNRKPIQRHLDKLISDNAKGRWPVGPDMVAFDTNGRLINGQHRCHMVIKTGIPVDCFVGRGFALNVFKVTDIGRARQSRDMLSIEGCAYPTLLGAAARALYFIERRRLDNQAAVSVPEVVHTAERHPELVRSVADHAGYPPFRAGSLIAATYWLQQCHKKAGEKFTQAFLTCEELKADHPAYPLHNTLRDRKRRPFMSEKSFGPMLCAVFTAYQAFMSAKPMRCIEMRYTRENFPWPKGGPYLLPGQTAEIKLAAAA